MMLNVRKRDLRNLSSYDYKVIATHVIDHKTIHKPIPGYTGHYGRHELPDYLKGFEDCYDYKYGQFYLKKEYDPEHDDEDAMIEEIIWMIDNDML